MSTDTMFEGTIPALYNRYLVPLLFDDYAHKAARRVASWTPRDILETAAGTGILTTALREENPDARILATDLNEAMLAVLDARGLPGETASRYADALDLPCRDESFDAVVCQFGIMFFPDKVQGNREAHRVLRDGGRYLLVIWDKLSANPSQRVVEEALKPMFPDNPPSFISRMPFGYSEHEQIEADLHAAGFEDVEIETIEGRSRAISPHHAAIGLTQGSPMRLEIEARDPSRLNEATERVAEALTALGNESAVTVPMSALFVTATK